MSDAPRNAWQCPSCGRQIPRTVDVCRCGSERRRLEALGYKFDTPAHSVAAPRPAPAASQGPAAALIGYRVDTDLSPAWRVLLKGFFALAVLSACAALIRLAYTPPEPTHGNIQVLTTLEEFTRRAGPDSGNTIPAFLASPGTVGVVTAQGAPDDPVRQVNQGDLLLGFCSQNIARQVRHEYPGYYEDWPDDKLVRTVLEKYPEYADRTCTLSFRLEAGANEIVKYELKPRSLLGHAGLWLRTLALTMAFAVACLNVYYRLIVARLAGR